MITLVFFLEERSAEVFIQGIHKALDSAPS